MAISKRPGDKRDTYFELIKQVPLRRIRSDKELDRAVKMVDSLVDRDHLDAGERDYLDVLSDLVERYETEEHPIAPVSDAEILAHLIEARGVNQATVSRETGISESTVSAILTGKRALNRTQIGRLCRYFHVEPGVFNFADA